ncbi:MAG: hypothetical protein U9P49_03315 [Thermodesulfobacteriota bacterium]|nr:hypothetical protein [Thermodesulfobacteriota bacterium]
MTEQLAAHATRFVQLGLTGYDACYAALAKEVKGVWLTFDEEAHRCLAGKHTSHVLSESLPKPWA